MTVTRRELLKGAAALCVAGAYTKVTQQDLQQQLRVFGSGREENRDSRPSPSGE